MYIQIYIVFDILPQQKFLKTWRSLLIWGMLKFVAKICEWEQLYTCLPRPIFCAISLFVQNIWLLYASELETLVVALESDLRKKIPTSIAKRRVKCFQRAPKFKSQDWNLTTIGAYKEQYSAALNNGLTNIFLKKLAGIYFCVFTSISRLNHTDTNRC